MGIRSVPVSAICLPAFVGCLLILTSSAFAQVETKPVVAHIALGWAVPTGELNESFEAGWLISGGAAFHPDPAVPLRLRIDFGHGRFDAAQHSSVSFPTVTTVEDGYTSMDNLSVDAIYDFGGTGHIGGYLGAGAGGYTRYQTLTQRIVRYPGICDPLIELCQVTTTVSKESDRLTKSGYDVSLALVFRLHSGSQIYIEGRYHWMISDPETTYRPVSIGYRW